jgi:putative membrane protein
VNFFAQLAVGLIAALHLYILVLEMFLWTTPRARAVFGTTPEFAEKSKPLAANQGLYNGFLAAGLLWSLLIDDRSIATFFVLCVAVAGAYGAATANKRILLVQFVPAAIAFALLWLR